MANTNGTSVLASLSQELAGTVEKAAAAVVRVDDGTRLTATGTIYSAEGIVVATSHGVERDENVSVELADGSRHAATVVGRDPDTDVAVLRVAASGLPTLPAAAPEEARVGSLVLALGRPGDTGLQATIGIISSRIESETNGEPGYLLHTDAVLYPGFSGGALVSVGGNIVGLTNLMYGRGRGIAIGTPIIRQVVETLLAHGKVQRGYLGVRTQLVGLPMPLREALSLEHETGLLIVQVEQHSPAEKGGLLLGDVLLQIDGQTVADVDELRRRLRAHHAGQTVAIQIVRGGVQHSLSVTLGAQ